MLTTIPTLFLLGIVLLAVFSSTQRLRNTTMRTASWWAFVGVSLWVGIAIAAVFGNAAAGWLDAAHYGVAVILLCPLIAVLGARRPSANVWNLFVLVPLILVLMWPVVASADVMKGRPLELESPTMVAFVLVLVMGAGNYFGTLSGFPAFIFACCQVCLVLPLWGSVPDFFMSKDTARLVAALSLGWSVVLIKHRRVANEQWEGPALTKLWLDFIDTYGMVWGKRVMDRVNAAAVHENWGCRLELDGFAVLSDSQETAPHSVQLIAPDATTLRQAEPIVRWLMKRFVNEDWVAERIGIADPDLPTLTADALKDSPATG